MKKLKIGLIGAGGIGKDHARTLVRNRRVAGLAFYDADVARAAAAANEFGGTRATSVKALVDECDVVWICTPPFARRDAIQAACAARKPIFCEKPLALSESDLKFVERAVTRARVPFFMGQSGRYSYFFAKMKELVAAGAIGRPVNVWSTRLGYLDPKVHAPWRFDDKLGGGVLIELGVHELDFIRWIGGDWVNVSAVASSRILKPGKFQDTFEGIGALKNGVLARLTISWATPRYLWQRGVEGEAGSLFFDDARVREVHELRQGKKPVIHRTGDWIDHTTRENLSLKEQAIDVLDAINSGRKPAVTLADGAAAVRAALAMRASAKSGRAVKL